jgi:hypothetical protein
MIIRLKRNLQHWSTSPLASNSCFRNDRSFKSTEHSLGACSLILYYSLREEDRRKQEETEVEHRIPRVDHNNFLKKTNQVADC